MLFDSNYRDEHFDIPFTDFTVSKRLVALVAAGGFVLTAFLNLIITVVNFIRYSFSGGGLFSLLVSLAVSLGFAALIVLEQKNAVFPAVKLIGVVKGLFSCVGAAFGIFKLYRYGGFFRWALNLLGNNVLSLLSDLVLLAVLLCTMIPQLKKYEETAKKFWFIAPAAKLISDLVYFFTTLTSFKYCWYYYILNFLMFVTVTAFAMWAANAPYAPILIKGKDVMETVGDFFEGLSKKSKAPKAPKQAPAQPYTAEQNPNPAGQPIYGQPSYQNPGYQQNPAFQQPIPVGGTNGHVDMLMHVLLTFLTCGIYYYFWQYKVTKWLNEQGEPYRDPTVTLLLLLFVPFYSWFWIGKTAALVDDLAARRGAQSSLKVLSIVFALLCMYYIPVIMIQSKINELCGPQRA